MYIDEENISPKDELITILLALGFGFVGAHRFYLGKWISGLIMVACFTCGVWGTMLLSNSLLSGWSWFWLEFGAYALVYLFVLFDIFRIYTETMTDGKGRLLCSKATKEENGIYVDKSTRFLKVMWICIGAFVFFLIKANI